MENSLIVSALAYLLFITLLGIALLRVIAVGLSIRKGWRSYYYTPEWKQKREEAFVIHGKFCCICGTTNTLHVHHLRYWKWGFPIQGRENPKKDLRVLCKAHHPKGYYPLWRIKIDQWLYKKLKKK